MKINAKILKRLAENKDNIEIVIENIEKELKAISGIKPKTFLSAPKIGGQGFEIVLTYFDKKGHPLFEGAYTYDGVSTCQIYFVDKIKHLIIGSINSKFYADNINQAEKYLFHIQKVKMAYLE